MLPIDINKVEEKHLNDLIDNKVSEDRTLEYKTQLPTNSEEAKREFLCDVSSFANTIGGYLIFGLQEEKGIATRIIGIEIENPDAELLRLEGSIASGLQPRIDCQLRFIGLKSGKYALIIRVRQSFLSPHRVTFRGHDKFYGRNSNGKYSLDVDQLRSAFLQSGNVEQQIREFHLNRVLDIESGRGACPLEGESKVIIHFIPREAFSSRIQITQDQFAATTPHSSNSLLRPIYASGWDWPRVNLEGWISDTGQRDGKVRSYLQVFRKGIIEAVGSSLLGSESRKIIPTRTLETQIVEHVKQCLTLMQSLDLSVPVYVYISYTNIKGFLLEYGNWFPAGSRNHESEIRQNVLNLPETVIEGFDQDVGIVLKPSLDVLWHAAGLESSPNFV